MRELLQQALDTPYRRYSIKPHGNGYAIYRDRDLFHHGYNLGHLTEATTETIKLIEDALNGELAKPVNEFNPDWDQQAVLIERIRELEAELAKPEQEPVAWGIETESGEIIDCITPALYLKEPGNYAIPLYTSPPRKKWVGLTEDERNKIFEFNSKFGAVFDAEAKLRSKNA